MKQRCKRKLANLAVGGFGSVHSELNGKTRKLKFGALEHGNTVIQEYENTKV